MARDLTDCARTTHLTHARALGEVRGIDGSATNHDELLAVSAVGAQLTQGEHGDRRGTPNTECLCRAAWAWRRRRSGAGDGVTVSRPAAG
jgi:hypothetical protein